jgi:hypothetical protein
MNQGMETGQAIPEDGEQLELDFSEPESTNRVLAITLAEDGKISLNTTGTFQVHEVFGAIYTTLADLTIQQFVFPGLKQVIASNKLSVSSAADRNNNLFNEINENIIELSRIISSSGGVSSATSVPPPDKTVKLMAGLEDLLSSFKQVAST